jgi:uncharacterized protein YtpQ (UPF0354 family)
MFGLFKKRQAEGPDRSTIVPRIKTIHFVSALKDRGIPADQMPITQPLVGELVVTYAFDMPGLFQMVNPHSLERLGIEPKELHALAVENLKSKMADIGLKKEGPILFITAGNDLEACSLLARKFWDKLASRIPGEMVVSVPSRNIVLITSSQWELGMKTVAELTDEAFENASNNGLTKQFLAWRGGKWEVYSA